MVRGSLFAAYALSFEGIIPIDAALTKSSSRTLISAPVSTRAAMETPLREPLIRGDIDF